MELSNDELDLEHSDDVHHPVTDVHTDETDNNNGLAYRFPSLSVMRKRISKRFIRHRPQHTTSNYLEPTTVKLNVKQRITEWIQTRLYRTEGDAELGFKFVVRSKQAEYVLLVWKYLQFVWKHKQIALSILLVLCAWLLGRLGASNVHSDHPVDIVTEPNSDTLNNEHYLHLGECDLTIFDLTSIRKVSSKDSVKTIVNHLQMSLVYNDQKPGAKKFNIISAPMICENLQIIVIKNISQPLINPSIIYASVETNTTRERSDFCPLVPAKQYQRFHEILVSSFNTQYQVQTHQFQKQMAWQVQHMIDVFAQKGQCIQKGSEVKINATHTNNNTES